MAVIPAPGRPTHELGGTSFTSLATPTRGSTDTSVWLVEVPPGGTPVPHQLTREEIFVVLDGAARVRIGAEWREAAVGDAIVVPAATPFELGVAGDQPLRALCCLPVGGQAQVGDNAPFTPPWAQ